jgi:hypothetical protein
MFWIEDLVHCSFYCVSERQGIWAGKHRVLGWHKGFKGKLEEMKFFDGSSSDLPVEPCLYSCCFVSWKGGPKVL